MPDDMMDEAGERFRAAVARIDAANGEDPNREMIGGVEQPKELAYGERMSAWLERLAPDASEALRLAARAQHIRRWRIPRGDFPMDRAGYHRWRTTLYRFHADTAGALLAEVGYDAATIARVQALIRKEKLQSDPEMQMLEDVICLVFLENYLAGFSAKHDAAKVVEIVRKTWRKMSPRGQQAALALPLPPAARGLVERALAP
ncbi:MAG TPA: DUF4202 domain-containing protein [Candidatus Sulfotelmatobacter sp.]|nr:DUF4202 domain-containing protein [Candidatus Sulfotelmatobacter sp.]